MRYLSIILLAFSLNACSQNNRTELGKSYAESELKLALSKESQHNVIDTKMAANSKIFFIFSGFNC